MTRHRRALQIVSLAALLVPPVVAAEPGVLASLDPDKAIHQYVHDVWVEDDGMPPNAIYQMVQTRDGYLWLGTLGALIRFDGVRFTELNPVNTPELPGAFVLCLHESSDGTLWVGLRNSGLALYKDGEFTTLDVDDALPGNTVNVLAEDHEGRMWIGTSQGLASFDGERFEVLTTRDGLPDMSVTALHESEPGVLWVGTEYGGLARLEGSVVATYDLNVEGFNLFVRSIAGASDDLWIATDTVEGQLVHFDGKAFEPVLGFENVRVVTSDRDGVVWAGGLSGLGRIHQGKLETFTVADGLSDYRVFSLLEDREASLWIGTYRGLNRLKDGAVTTISKRDGLADSVVNSIYEDARGVLWAATPQGLSRFQDGVWTSFDERQGLRSRHVTVVVEDPVFEDPVFENERRLWVGTRGGGLHLFDGSSFEPFPGLGSKEVTALRLDRTGALWIGTSLALYRYAKGTLEDFGPAQGAPRTYVQSIFEDRAGRIWVGTQTGLLSFDGQRFVSVDAFEGLWLRGIYEDDEGVLWIGTVGRGLARYQAPRATFYMSTDGLSDDFVWHVLEDDAERFWMCSDKGIFSAPKEDFDALARGETRKIRSTLYGQEEGVADTECMGLYHPGSLKSRDGTLWFPTAGGAVRVEPGNQGRNTLPPPVRIESVSAAGTSVELSPVIRLTQRQRDVEIHYTALSLRNPERVAFKVRLEGYDGAWIDAGTRRVAYYTNLTPGDYTFRVIASNDDGVWNEDGASVEFSVAPYFYETGWFRFLCVLLLLGLGHAIYTFMTRRIRARNLRLAALNEELEARNAEMERFTYTVSHDLRSPLVTIKGFVGLLVKDAREGNVERMEKDARTVNEAADRMHLLLSELLELSRVGRLVNPSEAVDLSELAREAAAMVELKSGGRDVALSIEPAMPEVWGDRLRLLEVFQNLIENAVKFMGPQTEPRVEVGTRGAAGANEVTCYVRDNGVGIDTRYQTKVFELFERLDPRIDGTGIGLALVKRIVEFHGGEIVCESAGAGKGTEFRFTLPLRTLPLRTPAK